MQGDAIKQMQTQIETIFQMELLQPDKLSLRQRVLYRCSVGLVFGLIGALLGVLVSALPDALPGALVFGLSGALIGKIETVEAFTWSWSRTRQVLPVCLPTALLIGLIAVLAYDLVLAFQLDLGVLFDMIYWLFIEQPSGLIIGFLSGLLGGLAASLAYGFTMKQLAATFPNEGVRRSVKNGLIGALIGGLLGALFSVLLGRPAFVLPGALVGGMTCGLRAVIQHVILHFWQSQ